MKAPGLKSMKHEGAEPAPQGGPPVTELENYDRVLADVHELQELTRCKGWSRVFGTLLGEAADATRRLESVEKMHEVIRCQATIALVREQKAKLRQPVDDLNGLRGRYPLFTQDFPYRADYDEATGQVTLINLETPESTVTLDGLEDASAGEASTEEPDAEQQPGLGPEPGDPFDD